MIVSARTNALLIQSLRFMYIRKSKIDEICEPYGDSWMDYFKKTSYSFAHIGK